MRIIGLLSIPNGIYCKKDALGQNFSATISGYSVNISFPSVTDDEGNENVDCAKPFAQLNPPINGKTLRLGGEKIEWGYPMSAPAITSLIKHVTVEIDCTELEYNGLAQKLYGSIQEWVSSFKQLLQLLTHQNLEKESKVSHPGSDLYLLVGGKYIQNKHPQVLNVSFLSDNVYASYDEIQQAMDFASSGKELLLEYQMLLSAYYARKEGKNRQAIVDACSAVELCLLNYINSYCNQKGIVPEILTEKYKSLGDRFKLVKTLDNNFPAFDVTNVIVKPRNDVAHNRNVYPTNECTDKLIEMVEKYLSHYHTSYY